jgi:hypothetical protein
MCAAFALGRLGQKNLINNIRVDKIARAMRAMVVRVVTKIKSVIRVISTIALLIRMAGDFKNDWKNNNMSFFEVDLNCQKRYRSKYV